MERHLPEVPSSEKEGASPPHFSRNQRGKESMGHITSLVINGTLKGSCRRCVQRPWCGWGGRVWDLRCHGERDCPWLIMPSWTRPFVNGDELPTLWASGTPASTPAPACLRGMSCVGS